MLIDGDRHFFLLDDVRFEYLKEDNQTEADVFIQSNTSVFPFFVNDLLAEKNSFKTITRQKRLPLEEHVFHSFILIRMTWSAKNAVVFFVSVCCTYCV